VNSNFPSKDEKQKRAMTIIDLLQYLHQRILDNLARQDEEELNYLSTTLRELWEAVEQHGDSELYVLLDDMNYVLNETLMGAQPKGERTLAKIASQLAHLKEAEQEGRR
jgi:hypothetical protein